MKHSLINREDYPKRVDYPKSESFRILKDRACDPENGKLIPLYNTTVGKRVASPS
jgi:hypothetical protein